MSWWSFDSKDVVCAFGNNKHQPPVLKTLLLLLLLSEEGFADKFVGTFVSGCDYPCV
jgi:hypothetical protein